MATRQDGVENRDEVYSTGAAFSLSSFTFSLSTYRVCDHLIVFYKSTSSNNRAIHTKNNRKQLPIYHLSQRTKNCAPKAIDDRRLFSAQWEIHFHCKEIKSFCLPSKDISENDECNILCNLRPSKRRVITGPSFYKSLCHAMDLELDHPRRFLVTWSGNDHETTHETNKRNDWSVTN